jgi:hypothetical protein
MVRSLYFVVVVPDLVELDELEDDDELEDADAVAGVFADSDFDGPDFGESDLAESDFEESSLAWCLVPCLLSDDRESVR